jgi:hypothetical protein
MRIFFCLLVLNLAIAAQGQSLPDTAGRKWWREAGGQPPRFVTVTLRISGNPPLCSKCKIMIVNAKFSVEVVGDLTEAQVKEWLEWQFGIRKDLPFSHPLYGTEFRDIKMPYTLDVQL